MLREGRIYYQLRIAALKRNAAACICFLSIFLSILSVLSSCVLVKGADPEVGSPALVLSIPLPPTVEESDLFSVVVNGKAVAVEKLRFFHVAHFSFAGRVEVKVRLKETVEKYTLSPLAYNIESISDKDIISFSLDRPRKLMLHDINNWKANDWVKEPRLVIWADPLEEDVPDPSAPDVINVGNYRIDNSYSKDETAAIQNLINTAAAQKKVLYFPPGTYKVQWLDIVSNSQIYLAPGSRIKGSYCAVELATLALHNIENARIYGRGSIDGFGVQRRYYTDTQYNFVPCIKAVHADNVQIEGIAVLNPSMWNILISESEDWHIRNVKLIDCCHRDVGNASTGSDGIDSDDARNILVEDSMVVSGDDCFAVKSISSTSRFPVMKNILYRNCVCYNYNTGRIAGTGSEVTDTVIDGLIFENIDAIRAQWVIAVGESEHDWYRPDASCEQRNIYYRNIRSEENTERLIGNIDCGKSGNTHDIYLQSISAYDWGRTRSKISGFNHEHKVSNVFIDNLEVAGELQTELGEARNINNMRLYEHFVVNDFVENVKVSNRNTCIVNIKALGLSVPETGNDSARFVLSRTGSTAADLAVKLSIKGTAENGIDFELIEDIVLIQAGTGSTDIVVRPINDAIEEDRIETVRVLIDQSPEMDYMTGPDYQAVITIVD